MTIEEFFTQSEMKDGFTTPARVEELFTLLQRDNDGIFENVGDKTRVWSTVSSIIAATQNKDCLDLFIQLDGLGFINKWLKDAQTFSSDTDATFSEEVIIEMIRGLEKLRLDNKKSVSSGIWVTIKNLIDHKSSEVQDMARSLLDSWKQDADSNEVPSRETVEPAGVDIHTPVNEAKESAKIGNDIMEMQKINGSEKLDAANSSKNGIESDSKGDTGFVSVGKSKMDDGGSSIQDGESQSDILRELSGNKRKLGEIEGPISGAEKEDDSLKMSDIEVEDGEEVSAKVEDGINGTESNTKLDFIVFDLNQVYGSEAVDPPAPFGFDLNVSEEEEYKTQHSTGEKQIYLGESSIDLNVISDGSEYQTLSHSSSASSSRIFDLNDQPFPLNDYSSHQYFGMSSQYPNSLNADDKVITLMGTKIAVNPKGVVPHTPSWKDVSLPNVHPTVFGYNGLTLGPTGPIKYMAAPIAPQLMTAFSQPPFVSGSNGTGPMANNLGMSNGLRGKGKEPDSGWELYPFKHRHQEP